MSKCTDKRFKDLMHHYELGLLPEEDREAFEQHLLDCDECFNSYTEFQSAAQHIIFSPKVRDEISKLAEENQETQTDKAMDGKRTFLSRKLAAVFVPTFLIAFVVVLILVLKPWHLEFQPTREAVAAENRLAIMYFDNLTDAEDSGRLGEIVTSLLIADLTDSRYIQVISSQRLHDIMRQLQYDPKNPVDRNTATQIAQTSQAKWFLTGKIVQVDPKLIITYEIAESSTGNVTAADQITGDEGETVFALIDRITIDIRDAMALPAAARQEADRLVTEITTHSTEAYRYYLEGLEYSSKMYFPEAIASFKKALEYDSTFAMVYYYLARYKSGEYITRALEYSCNTTRLEKYYIEAQHAFQTGDKELNIGKLAQITEEFPDEKRAYFELGLALYSQSRYEECLHQTLKAIEIDPMYKSALNQLAYTYDRLGDFENSILTIDRYISLAPNEANPYDTRGDLYARNGYPEKAIESFEKALEIKPDYYSSLRKLGHLYLFKRDFDKAEQCYQSLLPSADSGYYLRRIYPALIPYYKGKFEQAISEFDEIIQKQDSLGEGYGISYTYRIKAFIYHQQGNLEWAISKLEKSIEIYGLIFPEKKANDRHLLVQFYADNGDFGKAEQMTLALQNDLTGSGKEMFRYWYAVGATAMAQNRFHDAVDAFEKAADLSSQFPVDFMLGRAYLETGNYEQAVESFEASIGNYEESLRLCLGAWNVKMHYYLGMAFEQSRWYNKAIKQYEIFLEFWKDADPGIEEITEVKERLRNLKSKV